MYDRLQTFIPDYQMYPTRSCYCASISKRGSIQGTIHFSSSQKRGLDLPGHSVHNCLAKCALISRSRLENMWFCYREPGWRWPCVYRHNKFYQRKFRIHAELEVASAIDVINDLGLDTLTFLAVTVIVVPAFRILKASPVSKSHCISFVFVWNCHTLLIIEINFSYPFRVVRPLALIWCES